MSVNFHPVSADLIWGLTSRHNSFLVKRESGRLQMSSSPFNVMNTNSFKYCGISNGKAVDISGTAKGELSVKVKSRYANSKTKARKAHWNSKPAYSTQEVKYTRDPHSRFRGISKSIKNIVGGYYRPDLVKPALARWTKYHRALLAIQGKKAAKSGKSDKKAGKA